MNELNALSVRIEKRQDLNYNLKKKNLIWLKCREDIGWGGNRSGIIR